MAVSTLPPITSIAEAWQRARSTTSAKRLTWKPHDGPQAAFLKSDAYEALYGGAAGGGKSDALLFGGLEQIAHPQYKALILRRTFPELRELMDRSQVGFREVGGEWNEQRKRWTFPSGATYEFGYCESYNDVFRYQGQQYAYIAFDELGQLAEERIWTYLMSRNRAAVPGIKRQMRASANPGGAGHHWIRRRFVNDCPPDGTTMELTLDGGATTTRAFFQAFLTDNPTLLQHDPEYAQRLHLLPELEYKWLALGDWDAGAGLGLAELNRNVHLVKPFEIPGHWMLFGAFDWGYAHPFCFGLFAADEQGAVILIDSVHGRQLQPPMIAQRVKEAIGDKAKQLRYTVAGHDCWADVKARSENIPTIAEHFVALGLPLIKANTSRVAGVQNVRRYLTWKKPDGTQHPPRFLVLDTPSNRKVYECLESRVSDPDHPEDILKTDADHKGEGGDDPYDMVRYGLASRAISPVQAQPVVGKHEDKAREYDYKNRRFKPDPEFRDDFDGQVRGRTHTRAVNMPRSRVVR